MNGKLLKINRDLLKKEILWTNDFKNEKSPIITWGLDDGLDISWIC